MLCAFALLFASALKAEPAVIVNDAIDTGVLNRQSVQAIFTMSRQHWDDRQAIVVVVLPSRHPAHAHFVRNVLDIYPYQLKKSWDRLIFSGRGVAPDQVVDETEMLQRVASQPGAIGYVSDKTLAANVKGVKIVENK
ncbi:MAG: hypothetical protein AseanaTS_11240 [Candidatus Pelagadaptatus aseana]